MTTEEPGNSTAKKTMKQPDLTLDKIGSFAETTTKHLVTLLLGNHHQDTEHPSSPGTQDNSDIIEEKKKQLIDLFDDKNKKEWETEKNEEEEHEEENEKEKEKEKIQQYKQRVYREHILPQLKIILSKKEMGTEQNQETITNETMQNLLDLITKKISTYHDREQQEQDPGFKEFTTTYLLAQKYCNEFGITAKTDKNKEQIALLESYIKSVYSDSSKSPFTIDDAFFAELQNQKDAKHPITFIDITREETNRENLLHVKMWLYTLMAGKRGEDDSQFFTIENNNIDTFTLTENGIRLFKRIFHTANKLHRKLINDTTKSTFVYNPDNINDIQDILLGRFQKESEEEADKSRPPTDDLTHLDGYISTTESLFHLGSQKLRDQDTAKDTFHKIVSEMSKDVYKDPEPRKKLYDLTPFRNEVIEKAAGVVSTLRLMITGSDNVLDKETFLGMIDKSNTPWKWSIPVTDKNGKRFLFNGRCKELEPTANKMLNSGNYSHIDAFNDIVGMRLEAVESDPKNAEGQCTQLFQDIMNTVHSNETNAPQYFTLKGSYFKNSNTIVQEARSHRNSDKNVNLENGIKNNKTAEDYSECKIVFNGFELQISQQGNNTFGEKDDTLYASKKIEHILRRIMPHIYANPTLRTSLKNRVHTHRIDKKFVQLSTAIKEQLKIDSYIPDPNIVEEVCLIQLIHEIERQQLMKNKQTNILTSMPYTFTIQKLLQSGLLPSEELQNFENNETTKQTVTIKASVEGEKDTTIEYNTLTYTELQQKAEKTKQSEQSDTSTLISDALHTYTDPVELYRFLTGLQHDEKAKNETTIKGLRQDTSSQDDLIILQDETNQWTITEQQNILQNIAHTLSTISGINYTEEIQGLHDVLETSPSREKLEKEIRRIFWHALLDKKKQTKTFTHGMREKIADWFDLLGKKSVSLLSGLLHQSDTFNTLSPQINTYIDELLFIKNIEKEKSIQLPIYKEGHQDFLTKNDTQASRYYEQITSRIKSRGLYPKYLQFTHTYMEEYLEQIAVKNTHFASSTSDGNYILEQIKPAKIARMDKMLQKYTEQNNPSTKLSTATDE